uniref:SPX domain-containing protein n=1 Tax=Oryza punctata TaxID=4537 RepID=A0A0E0LDA1_ORYPU
MKFGKSLSSQIVETLPEWRDKFLSYKDLKKRLKLIGSGGGGGGGGGGEERQAKRARVAADGGEEEAAAAAAAAAMTPEEADFMRLLEAELDKFNSFFVEKEEEYIIRQKELQDRVARAAGRESKEELMRVRKEIVDFHGEMVLLENYSALNYTGLVKILKKYDKRTGALIRLPFIQKVLQQPFFTTDLLYKLVKQCEAMLDQLLPSNELSVSSEDGRGDSSNEDKHSNPSSSLVNGGAIPELDEIEYMESMYMKGTVAALRSLKEIRSGSSTVSAFSLPPLQGDSSPEEQQELWNKIPVIEQAAK